MTKNQNEAKFVTLVVTERGDYELEFLNNDMDCIEYRECRNKEDADRALAYWAGPNKTLSAV